MYPVTINPQIVAFDQQEAEVARQIGMAEEIVVAWPGRQQRDAGVGPAGPRRQALLHLLEEWGQPDGFACRKQIARDVGEHGAVSQRIADASRRLDVRVNDAPAAVGPPCQVERYELDVP